MANKKAISKINRTLIRSVLFIFLLLHAVTVSWGAITNPSVYISNDVNGDGIAAMGDTITISCRSTTTDASQYPYADLSAIGHSPMAVLLPLSGGLYSSHFTVGPGTRENNTPITFWIFDEDGPRVAGSLFVDNRRPNSIDGPSSSGATGLGSIFKIGNSLQIDITMSTSIDSDVPRANLTNIGLGSSHSFSRVGGPDSAPEYRLIVPFPMNREGNATPITVRSTDDAGNSRIWDMSVSYDTIAPEIHSVTAVNMTAGKTWVTAGDTIRISATISNYDFDTVRAYNPIFTGGFVNMVRVSGTTPGGEAVYRFDYPVTEAATFAGNFITFEVRATDNAGNESLPQISNPLRFDNIPPEFSSSMPMGVRIIKNGGIPNPTLAIIGDDLHFFGSLSSIMNDVTTTVDLSSIGGVTNQLIPFNNSATTTFELLYRIHQFTSEDNMPRAFTVTARDTAGNAISQVVLPIIYVDNNPPVISAGQVQNVSRPGQTVRFGDQIAIQANVTNLDGGSVWVNFERLGGTASSTLLPYSGSTYRLDQLVTEPTFGAVYDQTVSFTIFATDNAGNLVQTVTNSISIDNEPPLITGSAFSSTPAISLSHPFVRVGDRLTFRVQLASSSANVYDGQTVAMNLTEFGEPAPVPMVYDGVGSYTLSVDVPMGTLNNEYNFPFTATDNAGNSRVGTVKVKIDNSPPVVGPMTVNFLTDMAKAGAVNIGDRLEFIVPVNEPDGGTGTIDLSLVGGPSSFMMNYDAVLRRYYLVHDCIESAMENPSYVFRAVVSDKAGNIMNSVSPTFEVDCRPPVIEYASATHIQLNGNPGVVNIGDRVRIIAKVDLGRLDGGVPTVNLSAIGGSGAQILFDDGANNDGIAGDGVYGYTHTVTAGNTDGETIAFTVQITDNAGNRAIRSTESLFVDNKPLTITSVTNTQIFDNNGNGVVDLDGVYTTAPVVATDVVRLEVNIIGNPGDMGNLSVDLTKLGINNNAVNVPFVAVSGGWRASADFSPMPGTTNGEDIRLSVTLRDVNGNETLMTATNVIKVDNRPPRIETYPITFVVDNGRLNEANLNDVIQIRVRLSHHNDLLPQIEWTNLYLANGLTPPSPTLMMPSPTIGGEYIYQWTVPEGLGTIASLTILAYDQNGNMAYAHTNEIRFLSKTPVFAGFPQTRADLIVDRNFNNIVNPTSIVVTGDEIKITCVLTSVFNTLNSPPAEVLVDIRSITNSTSDDSTAKYNDGDARTYWTPLTYVTNSGSPYVYSATFIASASDFGLDASTVSFPVKVLHPDTPALALATSNIICDPANPFGIDTQVPRIKAGTPKMLIVADNGNNRLPNSPNIGDIIRVEAEIERFSDPGSATVVLYTPLGNNEVFRAPMLQVTGSSIWQATFTVATGTRNPGEELAIGEWAKVNGEKLKFQIYASDDADNLVASAKLDSSPQLTFDNQPPLINLVTTLQRVQSIETNLESWVANVGNGVASDSISAWVELTESITNGMAWIDLSAIGGTSTYMLQPNGVSANRFATNGLIAFPSQFAHYRLDNPNYDLATHTFRIYVSDAAGNIAFVDDEYNRLAVDTRRPELDYATYNGSVLSLVFTEPVRPTSFNINHIRIGHRQDHTIDSIINKTAVALDTAKNDGLISDTISNTMNVMLGSATRNIITDWGRRNLYISMAANDTQSGQDNITHILKDEAGNWLKPVSRNITFKQILIPVDFYTRPKLIGGSYNASLSDDIRENLYIEFDKVMDSNSMNQQTLKNLAIWQNRASSIEAWNNRYRFNTLAVDTYNPTDVDNTTQKFKIKLSQAAQDWIALKYGRLATQFHLQINGTDFEPPPYPDANPPLIRDSEGNIVMPVLPANSVAATLTPLNTPFQIGTNNTLDLSGTEPILTINIQNRRARLFNDTYNESNLTLTKTQPADLSRVFIYEKDNIASSRSLSLGSSSNAVPMVKWTGTNSFTELNDYASTTIRIPLTAAAMKIILEWGTNQFYIACSNNAFRDLWGNVSETFPGTSGATSLLETKPPVGGYAPARIHSVAVGPVTNNTALFKGYPSGSFFYEVAFETDNLSPDTKIPIARNVQPALRLFNQDTGALLDTGSFIAWLDHNQGGVTRTVARFANTGLPEGGTIQKAPVRVEVSDFRDIFNTAPQTDNASMAFDLSKKENTSGFPFGFAQTASQPMLFDNMQPMPQSVIPTGTIGITAAGGMNVDVTFNEPMDIDRGSAGAPTLRLGSGATTAMSFRFVSWTASSTARFTNTANFDANTPQGPYRYYVTGGFDEAGNRTNNGPEIDIPGHVLTIRSKGPVVDSFRVTTFQSTTAKNALASLYDAPFSPFVPPGIATITVKFVNAPRTKVEDSFRIEFFTPGSGSLGSTTLSIAVGATEGTATWNGSLNGLPAIQSGPINYELRIYDDANNEGSKRGSLIYDGDAPRVQNWAFSNVRTHEGKAYFSPLTGSFVKIDVFNNAAGQALKMRLVNPTVSTDTYVMTPLAIGGHTISFDGKDSNANAQLLGEGTYQVSLVDLAGNEGIPVGPNSKATATLVIDQTKPLITNILMEREISGNTVTRFNPASGENLKFVVSTSDPSVGSGTALIKISAGSTTMRELLLQGTNPFIAVWNGQDKNNQPVPDGTYRITVIDLAGNESAFGVDLPVSTSVFKITGVTQVNKNTLRAIFSHDIHPTDNNSPTMYELTPLEPLGISAITPITVDGKNITITFNNPFRNGTEYRFLAKQPFKSADEVIIADGNNIAYFTADTQGPVLVDPKVTFDGVTSQKMFNLVFNEELDITTAQQQINYTLTTGTDTLDVKTAVLRADKRSVTLTCEQDVVESKMYTIIASGVKDLFGNLSDGNVARHTFPGRDVTPPVLTISAFSNPANEFDISVVVKSNENLSVAPTATITQSGGTAISIILNPGPNSQMFIGGAHLDMNYPGVANIRVTGRDMSSNVGTANMSFATAFVNASARASIKSSDDVFMATFEPGTLNKDSMVAVMAEGLVKVSSERGSRILPSSVADLSSTQIKSIRASLIDSSTASDEELLPVGQAYSMNVPAGRIINPVKLSMKLSEDQIGNSIGLYYQSAAGWIPVKFAVSEGNATFESAYSGTFAMMKDIKAPRASMITEISDRPVREVRPTFNWKLEEYASGIDFDSAAVMLNGKIQPVMLDNNGSIARFTPIEDLVGGQYEMSLRISDKAGNQTITESIRFVAAPPLKIQEVVQFPNPARNRVNLRISTNRILADWSEVEVNIYDVAGHKVADSSNLVMRASMNGIYSVQDVTWDLRATGGKNVANGVYIARIVVRDPDDWNRKTRYNHKIAVLR